MCLLFQLLSLGLSVLMETDRRVIYESLFSDAEKHKGFLQFYIPSTRKHMPHTRCSANVCQMDGQTDGQIDGWMDLSASCLLWFLISPFSNVLLIMESVY